jgi:hypothetical protein
MDHLLKRCKLLEGSLEGNLERYRLLSQKVNADWYDDLENGDDETEELSHEIERLLVEMLDCINNMKVQEEATTSRSSSHQTQSLIKRYDDIYFDYKSDFKMISDAFRHKKESRRQLNSINNSNHKQNMEDKFDESSSVTKLLKERNTLQSNMRNIDEILGDANDARTSLRTQRSSMENAFGAVGTITAKMPTFNEFISGIQRKKLRELVILALLIGLLLCFVIWYTFY